MLTEAELREALRVCFDPELPVNIVDLGLLHSVLLTLDESAPGAAPRFYTVVNLLRRTHDEQREGMLLGQVANRMAGIYAVSRSTVEYVDQPVWTADRISDAGREALGLNRRPKPGLVHIDLKLPGKLG